MDLTAESEHVDLLLALALVFGETAAGRAAGDVPAAPGEGDGATEADMDNAHDPLDVLAPLSPSARQAVERRADWYARLPRRKQLEWLAHMLRRARAGGASAQLDEHVHPSHVVEALGDEPPRVRQLVVRHLPPALADAVAAELGITLETPSRFDAPGGEPSPEVLAVVRREVLSRFTSPAELERTTPLELLSGAELARLVRLLGVRETAVACRGIEAVEALASFLRRFPPEDAHAIAAHIRSLTEVDARRIAFAEQLVREALLAEAEPGAMLDRAGLRLLALTLAGRDNRARLRYTAQKLPVEAARWLEETARAATVQGAGHAAGTREVLRAIARETESVAAGIGHRRRAYRAGRRGRDPEPPARPA